MSNDPMSFHDHRRPRIAAVLPAAKQLGPVTLAIRAMRAAYALGPKAPKRQTGPVTEAIRTMRAAVPDFDANPDLIALRQALANRIEADIAALDMLGGDPDLEDGGDAEPSLGSVGGTAASRGCNQLWWARNLADDGEAGCDTGIADACGLAEQRGRHLRLINGGAA